MATPSPVIVTRVPENIGFFPERAPAIWDKTEIRPCRQVDRDGMQEIEECQNEEAEFWSVYLRELSGIAHCVADLPSRELAEAFAELLTITGCKIRP